MYFWSREEGKQHATSLAFTTMLEVCFVMDYRFTSVVRGGGRGNKVSALAVSNIWMYKNGGYMWYVTIVAIKVDLENRVYHIKIV